MEQQIKGALIVQNGTHIQRMDAADTEALSRTVSEVAQFRRPNETMTVEYAVGNGGTGAKVKISIKPSDPCKIVPR